MKIYTNHIPDEIVGKWNLFLESHPENTIFQSPDIFNFYSEVNNYLPCVFISETENGDITGLLLAVLIKEHNGVLGYFSSRVIIYGGPLLAEAKDSLNILDNLLSNLVKTLKKKSQYIQFRNFFKWTDEELNLFKKYDFFFSERQNLLIDTTDESKLISKISKSKLRQIEDGKKNGSVIRPPANISELTDFYNLLQQLYRKRIKKPLPDWSFFEAFYKMSQKGRIGIIRLVLLDNEVIGGIVAPVTANKNIYEWYIVGEDKEFKDNYPSVLATWCPIEFALKNKLSHFDLMGLGVPDKPYGVRDFKLKFGGKSVFYGRLERRNNKIQYSVFRQLYFLLYKIKGLF